MIATIIDCEETRTRVTGRPVIKFKVEIENEIHYLFASLDVKYFTSMICKHLRIPFIRKINGNTIISIKSQKDKILPVDSEIYMGRIVYKIAINRLNK